MSNITYKIFSKVVFKMALNMRFLRTVSCLSLPVKASLCTEALGNVLALGIINYSLSTEILFFTSIKIKKKKVQKLIVIFKRRALITCDLSKTRSGSLKSLWVLPRVCVEIPRKICLEFTPCRIMLSLTIFISITTAVCSQLKAVITGKV